MRSLRILWILSVLALAVPCHATTLVSDHFDMVEDTTLVHNTPATITSESAGSWEQLLITHGSAGAINSTCGKTGRGLSFSWANGDGTTEDGQLGSANISAVSYPDSVWAGFWFKSSKAGDWGSPTPRLKLFRIYSGAVSIIPELLGGKWNVYYNGSNHCSVSGTSCDSAADYSITDTNWHYYTLQFRGASTSSGTDGIVRIYEDGTLKFEDTSVDWGSADKTQFGGTTGVCFMGNLSGDYVGGAFTTCGDDFIVATTRAEAEAFLNIMAPVTFSGARF